MEAAALAFGTGAKPKAAEVLWMSSAPHAVSFLPEPSPWASSAADSASVAAGLIAGWTPPSPGMPPPPPPSGSSAGPSGCLC